jgi:hypothetical protein
MVLTLRAIIMIIFPQNIVKRNKKVAACSDAGLDQVLTLPPIALITESFEIR